MLGRVDEVDCAKNVAVVGHGHGRHAQLFYALAEFFDVTGAVEHGVVGMQVQVDELGHGFGRVSLPQPRQRKTGQICVLRGRGLVGTGSGGLGFLQQAAGLGDEFRHFEGLHEVGDIVLLQEGASSSLGAVGEGEQNVSVHVQRSFL